MHFHPTRLPLLALTAAWGLSALAAPPDAPDASHWAYQALDRVFGQIAKGYPDGSFRGKRPLTRYECAAAILALMTWEDQERAKVESLLRNLPQEKHGSLPAIPSDLAGRISTLETVQTELAPLVREFERELASLGATVEELDRRTKDLGARVGRLEAQGPILKITGDATLAGLKGFSRDHSPALTTGGFQSGLGRGSYAGAPVGSQRDISVLHDVAVTIEPGQEGKLRWRTTLGAGNALSTFRGFDSRLTGPLAERDSEVYLAEAWAATRQRGLRGELEVTGGRFNHRVPLALERQDRTPFFSNPRFDDRGYLLDGVRATFDWSTVDIEVFGARPATVAGTSGTLLNSPEIRYLGAAPLPVDHILGINSELTLAPGSVVRGGYLMFESNQKTNNGPESLSGMHTLTGSFDLKLKHRIDLAAGFAKNIYRRGGSTVIDNHNESYFASLGVHLGSSSATIGYVRRETSSYTNGDWGRIGAIYNPTGYTSSWLEASLPTKFGWIKGRYATANGVDPGDNPVGTLGLDDDDSLRTWSVEAGIKLCKGWKATASYESTGWDVKQADPYQRFWTLKCDGPLSGGASAVFGVQLSDADGKNLPSLNNLAMGGRFKGGIVFSQISYRF